MLRRNPQKFSKQTRKPKRMAKNPYSILGSSARKVQDINYGGKTIVERIELVLPTGKKRVLAKKSFIPRSWEFVSSEQFKERKNRFLKEAKILHLFERNGIRVPKNIKLDLRRNSLGMLMEDLSRHGRLVETHLAGFPSFENLSLQNNKRTIQILAENLKTIHSLGYFSMSGIDFWVFFATDKGLHPAVVDAEGFEKLSDAPKGTNFIQNNLESIQFALGGPEQRFFKKVYDKFKPKLRK